MKTYKIHIIRTGATSVDQGRRYVGQSDLSLCGQGIQSLEELKREFVYPEVDLVFTSPLQRCRQTAEILYPEADTVVMEGFADMNLGDFEGRTFEELRNEPDFVRWLDNSAENPPPGGEDTTAFTQRIVAALGQALRYMMDQEIGQAALVTHGGVIMTLLAGVGIPKHPLHEWAVANGAGYSVSLSAQLWMRDGIAEVYGVVPFEPGLA